MRRSLYLCIFSIFVCVLAFEGCTRQPKEEGLLLDDFEGAIIAAENGTIDAGSGNDSQVEVRAAKDVKKSGGQSLKVSYDAVAGGYIWVARGYGLDVKTAAQWLKEPEAIDWTSFTAISFYIYGSASGAKIAFDVKDAGGEMFRFMVTDDTAGWKKVVCPFEAFFARGDWQPADATTNSELDFPIKSFQFEPIAVAKGVFYIDEVRLLKGCGAKQQ